MVGRCQIGTGSLSRGSWIGMCHNRTMAWVPTRDLGVGGGGVTVRASTPRCEGFASLLQRVSRLPEDAGITPEALATRFEVLADGSVALGPERCDDSANYLMSPSVT